MCDEAVWATFELLPALATPPLLPPPPLEGSPPTDCHSYSDEDGSGDDADGHAGADCGGADVFTTDAATAATAFSTNCADDPTDPLLRPLLSASFAVPRPSTLSLHSPALKVVMENDSRFSFAKQYWSPDCFVNSTYAYWVNGDAFEVGGVFIF